METSRVGGVGRRGGGEVGGGGGGSWGDRWEGPKTENGGAAPPRFVGRPKLVERYERTSSIRPAGVLATACRQWGPYATREVPAVIAVWINWQLVRDRPGWLGWRRGS